MTGILLAILLFRAYVPIGFMPASGTPFLLELCPAAAPMPIAAANATAMGMPMSMDMPMSMPMPAHHHQHSDTHGQFQTCPFGSVPASGPIAQGVLFSPPAPIASSPGFSFATLRLGVRRAAAHQPRGPPSYV